ncbi:vWA domain-containing protein [Ohtaekwangia kribbensis]|jgi:Ca-activated chloride channel family protein|uniref:VWA domain-containing protein n=1 Tax=Ohtaekwangia kribbensis TaxID=688913 RepID=A0ABW3K5J8_9BACT
MDKDLTAWYSLDWFTPSTLRSFTWEHPLFLYLIIAVPILFIVRWLLRYRFNQKLPIAITQKDLHVSPINLIRLLPEILLMLVLALILMGLARPQKTNEKVEQWTEGIDIMIALDISQSMMIEDFTPNRLEAAKEVARNFINGRVQDRIGLVVFAGDAFSLSPLTTDYELLRSYLDDISFEMIEAKGTAIGSAMAVVTNRMSESETKSKVCILLSDGENTSGNIDPITAAELASAYGIKIYTIVVGKEGMVPYGKDFFGRPQMIENTIDETTMRKMADIGGGQFFRATDNQALEQVFARINKYEKAEIKETRFKDTSDYYVIYLQWAMGLFLLWLLLKSTFITNVLQD